MTAHMSMEKKEERTALFFLHNTFSVRCICFVFFDWPRYCFLLGWKQSDDMSVIGQNLLILEGQNQHPCTLGFGTVTF